LADNGTGSGKKEQILEAAIKVFAAKGFFKAKVEEIAIEAKVGKGTVYEYFKSKQDLFQEMLKYILEIYLAKLDGSTSAEDTFQERLKSLVANHLKFIIDYREMAKVFMTEHPPLDEAFKEWLLEKERERLKSLQDMIGAAMETGEIRPVDPVVTAKVLSGVIVSLGNNAVLTNDIPEDISDIAQKAVNVLYSGLAG